MTHTTSHETANTATDCATLAEAACDLTVVQHRLRDLRRWTPEGATFHLDAAIASIAAALDSLHAEHLDRQPIPYRLSDTAASPTPRNEA
jgi:hypothetical protein